MQGIAAMSQKDVNASEMLAVSLTLVRCSNDEIASEGKERSTPRRCGKPEHPSTACACRALYRRAYRSEALGRSVRTT